MDPAPRPREGVVAVIVQDARFLVIRRSQHVAAPGRLCFPGGAVEPGETRRDALVRELQEELGVEVVPREPVWTCPTPTGVVLSWWTADLSARHRLLPAPAEVAACYWMTAGEIRNDGRALETNLRFLDFWETRGNR